MDTSNEEEDTHICHMRRRILTYETHVWVHGRSNWGAIPHVQDAQYTLRIPGLNQLSCARLSVSHKLASQVLCHFTLVRADETLQHVRLKLRHYCQWFATQQAVVDVS
jgi:hypothetical protein